MQHILSHTYRSHNGNVTHMTNRCPNYKPAHTHTQKKSINDIILIFFKSQNQQSYTIYLYLQIKIHE